MTLEEARDQVLTEVRTRLARETPQAHPMDEGTLPPMLWLYDQQGGLTLVVVMHNERRLIPEIVRLHVAAHDAAMAVLTLDTWGLDMQAAEAIQAIKRIKSDPQLHSRGVFREKRATPLVTVLAGDRTGREEQTIFIAHRGLPANETLSAFHAGGAPIVQQTRFSPLFMLPELVRQTGAPEFVVRSDLCRSAREALAKLGFVDHEVVRSGGQKGESNG